MNHGKKPRPVSPAHLARRDLLAVFLAAPLAACRTNGVSPSVNLPPLPADALLTDLERRAFDFFWETTDPATGLVLDRWPTPSFSSIAA
ncbi:MAG: hypothetical protein E6J88_17935, partial [Deltaproteobacteria bacterium]